MVEYPDEDEWEGYYDEVDDPEPDEFELAIQDCGQDAEGKWCSLVGTEYCDFECPFSRGLFEKKEQ